MPRPQRSCSTRDVQQEAQGQHEYTISKRALLGAAGALGLMLQQPQQPAQALPLAPLGDIKRVGGDKLVGLSPEQVKVGAGRARLACADHRNTGSLHLCIICSHHPHERAGTGHLANIHLVEP